MIKRQMVGMLRQYCGELQIQRVCWARCLGFHQDKDVANGATSPKRLILKNLPMKMPCSITRETTLQHVQIRRSKCMTSRPTRSGSSDSVCVSARMCVCLCVCVC